MNRFYRSTGSHLVGVAGFVRSEATEQRSLRRGAEPIASRIRRGRHGGKARADRKRRLGFERAEGQQKAQASQEDGLGQMVGVAGFEPTASWSRTMRATNLRYTPKSRMKAGLHLTGKAALSPSVKAKLPLPNRGEPQADRLFQRAPESKKKSSVSIVSFLPGFVNKKRPVVRIFSIGSRKRKAVRRENRIGQKKRGPQENDKNSGK